MAIKLNLRAALESLLTGFGSHEREEPEEDDPTSIVLLLRKDDFPTLKQISEAAERAFGVPFALENTTDYCVFQKVIDTLMQAGPHVLSFLFFTKPYYGETSAEFERCLPLPAQRTARKEHTAYLAVNYAKGPADKRMQYAMLARLLSEMLSPECTGAFVPDGGVCIPNNGALLTGLKQWGASFPGLR